MIVADLGFQTLTDAIALGAIYALMAVGIGLVFGVLRLVNFAYGQLVMAGAYTLAFTSSWPVAASVAACFAVVVALVALALLVLLLTRTTIGLHTRAAASDFRTARLLGVRANRVIAFAVLLSGVLAAIVAVLLTVQTPFVQPDFALEDTIVVLVGVVVGGIDRLWTATLGGFLMGFASGVINGVLPTDKTVYLPSAVFALVILVLLLRPAGLFAWGRRAAAERV